MRQFIIVFVFVFGYAGLGGDPSALLSIKVFAACANFYAAQAVCGLTRSVYRESPPTRRVGCSARATAIPGGTPTVDPPTRVRLRLRRAEGQAGFAAELRSHGWLVFSAPSAGGDWDLFVMRPDGSDRVQLTETSGAHEMGPRVSPDGKRLLFYRAPRSAVVGNNTYGTFELVLAAVDSSTVRSLGENRHWASWSPDSRRLACLAAGGICVIEAGTGREVWKTMARAGVVQQLVWSPDGRFFVGTANGLGPFWNIGVLPAGGGAPKAVSEVERYNCTPDWSPDSAWVLYARGIVGGQPGYAQLWRARRDGSERQLLYAEAGTHIYGGGASPDGLFLVFTRSKDDLGEKENKQITMSIMRLADAPLTVSCGEVEVRRIDLGLGWEPYWTASNWRGWSIKGER